MELTHKVRRKTVDSEPIEQQLKSQKGFQGGMYTGDNPQVEAADFRSLEVISTQRGSSQCFHLGDRKRKFSTDVRWNLIRREEEDGHL